MGGRHPQRAPSSPWLLHTVPLKHSSLRVVTDGKLFCSVLHTEELPAINSVSAIFLIYLGPSPVAENGFPNEMTKYLIANGNLLEISRCEFGSTFLPGRPVEIHFLPRLWLIPFHPNCCVCSNWRPFFFFFINNNVMLKNLALLSLRACSVTLFSVPSSSSSSSSKLLFDNPYLVPTCCLSVLTQAVFELGIFSW